MPPRHPNPLDKPRSFKESWIRLLRYLDTYRYLLLLAVIISLCCAVINLIGPQLIKDITNGIEEGLRGTMDKDRLLRLGMVMLILYIVSGALLLIQGFILARCCRRLLPQLYNSREQLTLVEQ